MSVFCYVLAAFLAAEALLTVSNVGKPKDPKPTTGGVAVGVLVLHAAMVTGLVLIAAGSWR